MQWLVRVYSGVVFMAQTQCHLAIMTVCSGAHHRKHQSPALLAFMRGINRWPVDSPHKGPVTHYPRYWPFVRGSTGHRLIPLINAKWHWVIIKHGHLFIKSNVYSGAANGPTGNGCDIWCLFLKYRSRVTLIHRLTLSTSCWRSVQSIIQCIIRLYYSRSYSWLVVKEWMMFSNNS